ncbi:MAG: hypothetical protein ACO2ZZ_06985 [Cyclobacteriaceae bacterium]
MKKVILTLLNLFLIAGIAFAQNQERLSVHYFDVPDELVEDLVAHNKMTNQLLEEAGFGKDFYKLYRVKDDDDAKQYRFFMISQYTSDKHYEMTHNVSDAYQKHTDKFWDSELGKLFTMDDNKHIYRKVYRIED